MTVWKVHGPLVLAKTTTVGLYPNDTWSGPRRHLVARALSRRLADRLALGRRAAASGRQHGVGLDGRSVLGRPEQGRDPACASHPPPGSCVRPGSWSRPTAVPEPGHPGQHRRSRPRCSFQRLRLPAVRIAFDVSPLSHPATGVGNYIRGTLARDARGLAGDEHELVAFAPTSLRGPRRIREALAGARRRDAHVAAARPRMPCALRGAWLGHPATERLLGPFDVLHFTDWMYPPQRAGVRATTIHDLVPVRFPDWTTGRTRAMHGRKYRNAARTCDVIFVNSAFTGSDVTELLGVDPERICVAPPGVKEVFTAGGPAADLGDALHPRRSATLEPRKNLQALVEAHRLLGGDILLVVAGGEGWGEQPVLDDRRVRRLGFVSDEELARSTAARPSSSIPRGSRGSGCRSSRRWHAALPSSPQPTRRWTRPAGAVAVRADPDDPAAIAAAIQEAIGERERLAAAGIEHACAVHVACRRRDHARGLTGAHVEGRARRGTARADRCRDGTSGQGAPLGALEDRPGLELRPAELRWAGAGRDGRPRSRLVPGRDRASRARARRPPLHDDARAGRRASPRRRHRPRSRAAAAPRGLPGLASAYRGASLSATAVPRADAVVAVSAFTRDELVELLRIPGERIRVVPNGIEPRLRPYRSCGER